MAGENAGSLVGDVRRLLQDVVTPDLKALAVKVDGIAMPLGELKTDVRRLEERVERRFDHAMSALDTYKDVQELKEFRIRMEERQRPSA